MRRTVPPDAFEYYVSLGLDRSHAKVAERYGVDKRTIGRVAKREDWTGRLAAVEAEAQKRVDEKLVDELEEMNERHLKTLQAINMRALEALRQHPLTSGMEAVRAVAMAMKLERMIRTPQRSEDEEFHITIT